MPSAHPTQGAAAPGDADDQPSLVHRPLRTLMRRLPICVAPELSIRKAAELMRQHQVSSLLVTRNGTLEGILTDRDLRNRVIAAGIDTQRPIHEVATDRPLTLQSNALAFDAMALMARHNIHHVPLLEDGRIAGVVTSSDLLVQQRGSAVYLAREIYRQPDLPGLQGCAAGVAQLQRHLVAVDATAHASAHVLTAITDALTARLLQLAQAELGPPPLPYAWVAAGSQARSEQTAKSDQDNCLLLHDDYNEQAHGPYFAALAKFVCDGLNACGYVYCPGEMMAINPTWRQPLRQWKAYFRRWIDTPEPKALMLTCVFFDQRVVHGDAALLDGLRADMLAHAHGKSLFLAHMVANALTREPPLSMLGSLQTARSGAQRGRIDIKHLGIVPVVDLARVYALAGGHLPINTQDRLAIAAQSGEISAESARDLSDALEYLAITRIRHQARQFAAGSPADSFLAPSELSNFERAQLRQAFGVVKQLQTVLRQRYLAGRF